MSAATYRERLALGGCRTAADWAANFEVGFHFFFPFDFVYLFFFNGSFHLIRMLSSVYHLIVVLVSKQIYYFQSIFMLAFLNDVVAFGISNIMDFRLMSDLVIGVLLLLLVFLLSII